MYFLVRERLEIRMTGASARLIIFYLWICNSLKGWALFYMYIIFKYLFKILYEFLTGLFNSLFLFFIWASSPFVSILSSWCSAQSGIFRHFNSRMFLGFCFLYFFFYLFIFLSLSPALKIISDICWFMVPISI